MNKYLKKLIDNGYAVLDDVRSTYLSLNQVEHNGFWVLSYDNPLVGSIMKSFDTLDGAKAEASDVIAHRMKAKPIDAVLFG